MKQVDLKVFPLFAEFTAEDQEALHELLEPMAAFQSRTLFSQNTEAEGLVLVVSGEISLKSSRSDEVVQLEAGAAIGGLSLMALGPREVTARADTACDLLVLSRSSFRRLVDDHPRTACRLTEAILSETVAILRENLDYFAPSKPH